MAIFTCDEGLFEITSISYSPSVILFGESISVTLTIKNVSGKAVSSMYILTYGGYATSDERSSNGSCDTGNVYLYGLRPYKMASISWANGASKTFSFNYVFNEGFYPVEMSEYILDKYLYLAIVTDTFFPQTVTTPTFAILPKAA